MLGLAAGVYAAVVFVPPAVLHYEVKQVVRTTATRPSRTSTTSSCSGTWCRRSASLDDVQGVDEAGRTVRVPVVDLQKEDVVWERAKDPPTLHVAFEYPRTLELPWLDRRIERVFRVDLTMDQKRADWGPQR